MRGRSLPGSTQTVYLEQVLLGTLDVLGVDNGPLALAMPQSLSCADHRPWTGVVIGDSPTSAMSTGETNVPPCGIRMFERVNTPDPGDQWRT